jgi:NADH:ubiquinone oxidoreductase subunit 6 (subunit J)
VTVNRANVFSLLVTAFVGAIFVLLLFETWALFTGNKPITEYVRSAVQAFPGWAFAIAIVIGIALGHFLWGPARGRLAPAPRRFGAPQDRAAG